MSSSRFLLKNASTTAGTARSSKSLPSSSSSHQTKRYRSIFGTQPNSTFLENFMNKSTFAAFLLSAVAGVFSVQTQAADAPTPPAAPTKPAAPTLSADQRATQKAASQASFAAMSREEKAANKGNKQMPNKPTAPAAPKGRK
jgi:hypothetical protein